MVKSTSLASVITLMEVTGIAARLIGETYRTLDVFVIAGAIYLTLNLLLTALIARLEMALRPDSRPARHSPTGRPRSRNRRSEHERDIDQEAAQVALRVDQLKKSFGGHEVLKGVSMDAREGEVISILGSSGSGKSTLLRCINLLEMPDQGRITVGGELIRMRRSRQAASAPGPAPVDRIRASSAWCSVASICGRTRRFCRTSWKRRSMC